MSQAQHEILETYYQEIKALYETRATKELSFRTPLENLLKALKPSPSYTIIQEAKGKEAKIQESKQPKNDEVGDKKTNREQNQATEFAKAEFANNAKPDFDVYKKIDKADELSYNSLVGFIECKDIDKDLDTQSEQIKRYLEISPNIILTNYRRFILLSFGKVIYDTTLFDENLNKHLFTQESKDEFFTLISAFFADTSTQIKSKAELVKVLSSQSFYLSISLKNAYDEGSSAHSDSTSALFCEFWDKTYDTFKSVQKVDFSELDFCDIISQSIVYGLFVSFVESENIEIDKIDAHSLITLLPSHFKTLHEFIYFSLPNHAIPKRVLYVLDNVKKTLALLDKASMSKFLNLEIEKIAIYLYEDFLKEYDELRSTQKRKQGGVFYTPAPVVEMIVSALDELLISRFGKKQGFLDSEVKVLDFATGTGSFLASVFEKIISKEREAFRNDTIKHKFLRDIYGFEISFVAYIVARLKLGQILKNAGFSDFSDADFCIYLNNTLDLSKNANFTMSMPLLSLDDEWKKARDIKHNKNLLVILGNPPYNVKSSNKGEEILKLLDTYKQGLNETNIQPLDDDYIKFIRFAQWKLLEQRKPSSLFDTSNKGLLGFITNNSYLDGRTHRKMRESLAKSFDEIYILNLHGDSREDENVFDIRVGVCISIFVRHSDDSSLRASKASVAKQGEAEVSLVIHKKEIDCHESASADSRNDEATVIASKTKQSLDCPSPARGDYSLSPSPAEGDKGGGYAKVHYFSTKNNEILRRNNKFALLNDIAQNGLNTIKWQTLTLESPYFWFVPKTFDNVEYKNFWALASDKALGESRAIFEVCNCGTNSRKDNLLIQPSAIKIKEMLNDMQKLERESILQKYHFKETQDWTINKQRENFENPKEQDIIKIAYRPFDTQFIFYPLDKINKIIPRGDSRKEIMQHFLQGKNIGIGFEKGLDSQNVSFISDKMIEGHFIGGRTYIALLYRYDEIVGDKEGKVSKIVKIPNFTKEFSEFAHKHKVLKDKSPEQILAFIYANLFNPHYRTKYLEYLKIGFPRVDFEVSKSKFETFANLGQKLIDLHLMRLPAQEILPNMDFASIDFVGEFSSDMPIDSTQVTKRYENDTIALNKQLSIKGITKEIWQYKIGGYEVLKQWLKYRKNYQASKDELNGFLQTCHAIKASIYLQNELAKIK
ncbi:type ISP restriction/modification enzyme [Helicobacter macacae]|uniref:site-specific DNA-methyltransferase (adenine-specific) n=1 Tax=Helicobacter macacae MIT 99-5501 TaxID=1357400 RepID=V8CAQ1_9HELI|nr:type ISP restriction/modification enzyme [Helicobacter macacae]ETD24085.1 hypothetical protein HMPREF2086_00832 [Helicobacter macacae MIT 99-5501]